jgi:glycosyltransferase involved in cell wall biosynthesis
MPRVTVVITTLNRPVQVLVALQSVLTQTFADIEVVVVVDGPDNASEATLATVVDDRLRVVVNPQNVGLAEARNVGVRHATADWVAFLDDDDEWLTSKLEKQVELAEALACEYFFIFTKFIERSDTIERILPVVLPNAKERFDEYMYVRKGFVLPSTILASRRLLMEVPFTSGLRYMEDIDWILRSAARPELKVDAVGEPLVIYNDPNVAGRESKNVPWTLWQSWVLRNRSLMSPKSLSLFISKHCVNAARQQKAASRDFVYLFFSALLLGSMTLECLVMFFAWSLFTPEARRKFKRLYSSKARESTRILEPRA